MSAIALPWLAVTLVVGAMTLSIAAGALLIVTMALVPAILALVVATIALSLFVAMATRLLSVGAALLVASVRAWWVALISLRIATHVWGLRIAIVSAISLLVRIGALMLLLTPKLLVRLSLITVRSGRTWRIIALLRRAGTILRVALASDLVGESVEQFSGSRLDVVGTRAAAATAAARSKLSCELANKSRHGRWCVGWVPMRDLTLLGEE